MASGVWIDGPRVSIVTLPARGACKRNQREWPPALPAWFGSPGSLLAPVLYVSKLPLDVRRATASANTSLSGTPGVDAGTVQVVDAGDGSVRPAASSARTRKVCEPVSRPSYARGEVHG